MSKRVGAGCDHMGMQVRAVINIRADPSGLQSHAACAHGLPQLKVPLVEQVQWWLVNLSLQPPHGRSQLTHCHGRQRPRPDGSRRWPSDAAVSAARFSHPAWRCRPPDPTKQRAPTDPACGPASISASKICCHTSVRTWTSYANCGGHLARSAQFSSYL